jgi:threonine dehydrogenase-like Zn-dependent dehydrogenase
VTDPSLAAVTAPPAVTMRAAVLDAPGRFVVSRASRPEPGPGEIRIRLEGSGVCHSNLPLFEGREWFQYPQRPGAPGHEGWGIVDELGPGVDGPRVGERVAALTFHAYAEYDIARADAVVPLPATLGGMPFPGEPLGCAMNIFRRSDVGPGHTVAVVGIGFLGALLCRLSSNAGARVIAVSRRSFSLEVATAFGAHETIPWEESDLVTERVMSLTDGVGCDRVIEAVGSQRALDVASKLARERGRLVIAGFHQDGPRSVDMFLWNWRGVDVVNAHERDPAVYVAGIREAVDAVASGALDPTPLYTHYYPLDQVGEALTAVRERPDGFLKALVIP